VEIWDAYDENENLLGIDLVRGEVIPSGMYHQVVSVLVKHVDGEYLLTQRCFTKIGRPGYWEASCGGSALKGDTPEMAAMREVEEETGLIIKNLVLVDKRRRADDKVGGYFHYTYVAETECDKEMVKLLEGETIDYQWVDQKGLKDFMASGKCIPFQQECLTDYVASLPV